MVQTDSAALVQARPEGGPSSALVVQKERVVAVPAVGLRIGRIVVSEIEVPKPVRKSGVKWMQGSTKRQCDRALVVSLMQS